MNYSINDMLDRLDCVENEIYQMQKIYKENPFMQYKKVPINQSFELSSVNNFTLGNLSTSKEVGVFVACKVLCSADTNVSLYVNEVLIGCCNTVANDAGMLCFCGGITAQNGGIVIKINQESLTGSLSDLSLMIDKTATFLAVAA